MILPAFWLFLLTSVAVFAVLASSVGLVSGNAGMISLCQMSFAGIGGWIVAYINAKQIPVPFPLQVLAGGLVALPIGVLIGLPALRLRGVNLAVVTLSFAAVCDVALTNINFPGGVEGRPVFRFGLLGNDRVYLLFCFAVFACIQVALYLANRQRFGSAWRAVKESERAAAALGLNVPFTKLTAFAASAFIAGIGGALMAGQLGLLSAVAFGPMPSLVLFATAVMAGARYPLGALIAGVLFVGLPEILSRFHVPPDITNIVFAVGTIQALGKGRGIADTVARGSRRPPPPPQEVARLAQASTLEAVPAHHSVHSAASSELALELRNVTVRYGSVIALDAVDLQLPVRGCLGIIGPNGAGKSSLVDAVTGFTRYTGSAYLGKEPIDGLSATRRAHLGLRRTFQQDRTVGDLDAKTYLRLSAGRNISAQELRVALSFAHVRHPSTILDTLDVGSRRLLEVAGVLAANPQVVFLDEPAAGLSRQESALLGNRIAALPQRYGCAVVLIEHDIDLVRVACERVVVLAFGKVIASGPTAEVLARADVIAAYLGQQLPA